MKTKTGIAILAVLLLAAANTSALKVKVFTMKELIDEADVIVVASIALENGEPFAKVDKAIKGNPEKTIRLHTFALRDTDTVRFSDREKVLLFLGRVEPDGGRKLIGYGDQAKWPKQAPKWPYTAAHTSLLEQVEVLVAELVEKQGYREQMESRLLELLRSDSPFNQVIALEYLESPDYQDLRRSLRSDIEKMSKSADPAVKQKASFVQSLNGQDGVMDKQ